MDPKLEPERRTQDVWKAEAIAQSLADMGLSGWAPGLNDWAAGGADLKRMAGLGKSALLAGNLQGFEATRTLSVGGIKLGIAGVSRPMQSDKAPEGVTIGDERKALEKAAQSLKAEGAQLRVALVAISRGDALRLAEAVPDFHVMIVGKPFDQGEANDGATPPVRIGETLIVQAPNHLQRIAVVDLHVKDGSFRFQDGSGLEHAERRQSLERRISELEGRLVDWEKPHSGVKPADIEARRRDLARLKQELAGLSETKLPESGSFFRYQLLDVADELGTEPHVASRLSAYYRRVNDHNKVAFADRKPPPVPEGKSGYLGVEQCTACHAQERAFWDKTQHAKAYETLVVQHKQFNLDCVSCHVTGYEKPGGSTVTHVENLTSVQCETCHGPGERHVADPKNPDLIVKSPPRSLCAPQCHHPPHVKETWSVDIAWKRILGPGHGG